MGVICCCVFSIMISDQFQLEITPRLHANKEAANACISAYIGDSIASETPYEGNIDFTLGENRLLRLNSLVVSFDGLLWTTCVHNEPESEQEKEEHAVNRMIEEIKCERTT